MAARAKKKITTTTEEVDDDELESNSPIEKLDDETIRALTEMEGASDIRWNVYRLGGPNPGFCPPSMTTSELTLENIARRYGSGHYRVKGFQTDGKFFKSTTITIAEPNAPAAPDLSSLMKDLNKSDQGMMPMLMAMMQSNTQIVTAALSRQPDRTEIPWSAIITASPLMLTAMKEFFAKKDADAESMEKILKLVTVVEKLKGNNDEKGTSWPDIIRDALPALSGMVTRAPAAQRSPTDSTNAVHPGTVSQSSAAVLGHNGETVADATGVETPEAVAPTPEVMAMDFFKRKFDELIANAAQNKDPELRAELFLDDLPSFIPDSVILEMLNQADWFERLCAFDARVANYQGWFTDLRQYLLQALNDEQPAGDAEKEGEV